MHYNRGKRNLVDLSDVTGLFFQLPQMHANYKRFSELLFIDFSIRQKNKATDMSEAHYFTNFVFMKEHKAGGSEEDEYLHIIILSGLNSEGQNCIFGVAVL